MTVSKALIVIRNPHMGTMREYMAAAECLADEAGCLADEVERLREFVRAHLCLCVGDVRCNRCKLLDGE